MSAIYVDPTFDDEARRDRLYDGDLLVLSPCPGSAELCAFAREMAQEAFAPHHPTEAQYEIPPERFAAILAELKPVFINHARSKELIQALLTEVGADPEKTYFDVPRLRTMAAGDYLKAGLAYAFHPHRDTWFSAPMCQLNWWLPVYEIESENSMAFHPRYWTEPVRNSSADYNYEEWKQHGRKLAAQQVKTDTRKQPQAEEPVELDPQVRVVSAIGGMLIFSAAQLHSTVPNTTSRTRFSIDFRTVHVDDVAAGRGAPNVDSASTGTTLGDFLRGSDLSPLPEELIAQYEAEPLPS